MTAETAMAAALKAAGVENPIGLHQAICDFLRDANGNRKKAIDKLFDASRADRMLHREMCSQLVNEVADDMKGLPGEGQLPGANGLPLHAPARQQNSEAGHSAFADSGLKSNARPLPANRDGRGQGYDASNGRTSFASPVREPSKAAREMAGRVAKEVSVVVLTAFDRYKVRDGRTLKKLQFHELIKLARENESESRALRYIVAHVETEVANPDLFAMLTDLISEEIVEKAFAFAKVAGNAH